MTIFLAQIEWADEDALTGGQFLVEADTEEEAEGIVMHNFGEQVDTVEVRVATTREIVTVGNIR